MVQTTPTRPVQEQRAYILGNAEDELERLIEQSRFFGDLTEQVLRLAGIEPGMRVLDVGCGGGDVSFLAAKLVGREGAVIGIDRAPEAVAVARQRATDAGLTHVHFLEADASALELEAPVDAIIGRLVLMYFAEPAVVLRGLLRWLAPGGVVAFQEMDMSAATSEPPCEVFETAGRRLTETFTRAGIDIRIGLKLHHIFREAGLPTPQMIQGARVEAGAASPIHIWIEQTTRTLLPLMERTGVATAAEVEVDTLAARLRAGAVATGSALVPPSLIGAWTRFPAAD